MGIAQQRLLPHSVKLKTKRSESLVGYKHDHILYIYIPYLILNDSTGYHMIYIYVYIYVHIIDVGACYLYLFFFEFSLRGLETSWRDYPVATPFIWSRDAWPNRTKQDQTKTTSSQHFCTQKHKQNACLHSAHSTALLTISATLLDLFAEGTLFVVSCCASFPLDLQSRCVSQWLRQHLWLHRFLAPIPCAQSGETKCMGVSSKIIVWGG